MILPLIIMLLLAWLMLCDKVHFRIFGKSFSVYPYVLLTSLALLIFVFYNSVLIHFLPEPGFALPTTLNQIPLWVESLEFWTGIVVLVFLLFYDTRRPISSLVGVTLCLMIFLQTTTLMRYGAMITHKQDTTSLEQMKAEKTEKLTYQHIEGEG